MSFTYDFTTARDISTVRLLVSDTDSTKPIFQDDEVTVALQMESSQGVIVGLTGYNPSIPVQQRYSYRRSAALLLNALSADKSRLGGMLKVLDIQIDTTKAASAISQLAKDYIAQEASAGYFAVAEMAINPFSMRERMYNMALRQNV
jgi:hypothetical protein